MNSFVRTMRLAALLGALLPAWLSCCLVAPASARSPLQSSQSKEPTGSISGRVTLGNKPAPGVTLLLAPGDHDANENLLPSATTDEDGHFQLSHVPAGTFLLQTFTPAFVSSSNDQLGRPGKLIDLTEGEAVDGVDIALTRGGVITGRITDANGRPLIQEGVRLKALDERGQKRGVNLPYSFMMSSTDDRGVYRLFGVPPGRYLVSAGVDTKTGYGRPGYGSNYYPLTYHPDTADDSKAAVVDITSGGEATGVDITLGRASKTYSVSGRVVDADNGKPVAGLNVGYGSLQPNGTGLSTYFPTGPPSNSKGEFRLDGIVPRRYAVFASPLDQSNLYSDPTLFQVTDDDVTGIEIKVHQGSTLSGVVAIEGANDQEGAPKLSDLRIGVYVFSQSVTAPRFSSLSVAGDGSFRATGLQAGKATFYLAMEREPKGLSLLRVARDGADQTGGVEIAAGEQVSGIRVVFGYGTGVIRGLVKVEGGQLPESARLYISCLRVGADPSRDMLTEFADARGRFTFEGLVTGDYEVSASLLSDRGAPSRFEPVKQTVLVTSGAETRITLPINLSGKQ
jgi:hypothetical protein